MTASRTSPVSKGRARGRARETNWRDNLPSAAVDRLKELDAERIALHRKECADRMTEADVARGWAVRREVTALMRLAQSTRSGETTTGGGEVTAAARRAGDQAASAVKRMARRLDGAGTRSAGTEFDRDSLRAPESIADRRQRDPWDLRDLRTHGRETGQVAAEYRSRALSAIEHMPGCSDAVRSRATDCIEQFDSKDSVLARHALVTSQPAYLRAWSKLITNKAPAITPEEWRAVDEVAAYRALTTVDVQGGYLIPFQLQSSHLIQTSPFLRSDLRENANVVVATSDTWHGPTAQNVAYAWQSEDTEASDAAPPFGMATVRNWTARAFLPITVEATQDMANLEEGIALLLASGQSDAEAAAFVVGTGIEAPVGLVTSLAATASSVVTTAAAGTFALADLYSLQAALSGHFRKTASWLACDSIYNKIREFAAGGSSSAFWSNITQDAPPILFGRNALEAEAMSPVVATTSPKSSILAFGDMRAGYTICDRWEQSVEVVPWLPGAHGRPSGTRGFWSTFRVGGDVTNSSALRLLQVQ